MCYIYMLYIYLVSYGYCNKLSQTGWLRTTETYFLTVLVGRSPNSRCQASFLFWFLAAGGNAWCSLACSCIIVISASVFTWLSSLCVSVPSHGTLLSVCVCLCISSPPKDSSHTGFRAHLIAVCPPLNLQLNYM